MLPRKILTSIAVLAAVLACASARAAEPAEKSLEKSPLAPDWLVTVQFGPGMTTTYPGAAAYRPVPIPGLAVRRSNEPERFSAPDDGFGAPIIDASGFHIGPVGNVVLPRWRSHAELTGLRKLHAAIEVGAYAEYYPVEPVRLRAELRQGFLGHHGLVATLGADFVKRAGDFLLSAGPRVNFGTTDYAKAYYGVTPAQALANGRVPAFRATGGVTSAGLMTTARYDFSPVWNATADGGLQRLTGSPAASPISNILGSRNQYSAGVLFARTFTIGGF